MTILEILMLLSLTDAITGISWYFLAPAGQGGEAAVLSPSPHPVRNANPEQCPGAVVIV